VILTGLFYVWLGAALVVIACVGWDIVFGGE
jgi:hypothetical protein